LLPRFLIVSNMQLADPRHIVAGNQRVVRPRLEDARFFFDQDRQARLEARVPQLAKVVYHNKLGSQLERIGRLKLLAGKIARQLGADVLQSERAAELAKADLLTGMVGEFPELQGVMGRYYALNDGELPVIADAIEAHYRPRFAGDALPEGLIACAVALADKLDAAAGLFSIGQQPTGDRDPFGLRRAALGIVRILVERELDLSLADLASAAFEPFATKASAELVEFVNDRFAGYLKDLGFSTLQVEAVLSRNPSHPSAVPRQLEAVQAFQALPEAESLAAANKRISNILKQAKNIPPSFDSALFAQEEEKGLASAYSLQQSTIEAAYSRRDYTGALKMLAAFKTPVDAFFDKVLVMDKDERLRNNRIALLASLHATMNRIADLSKLAA
jgi:glycyl-tRNA synthetase beta chain